MTKFKLLAAGLVGFLLGMGTLYVFLREKPPERPVNLVQREQQGMDPFAEAQRIQEEMEQAMLQGAAGSGASQQIEVKDEEKYWIVEVSDVDATTLSASVKSGMLVISGETRQQHGGATFSSSFQRMMSLPPNVDPSKMETMSEENKVVLRFPKKK